MFDAADDAATSPVEDNSGAEVSSVLESSASSDSNEGSGLNPAWSPLLEKLPTSLHPLVTPELSKWDKNFQTKLQEVQSGYKPYEAYKEFVDAGVPVDQLQKAQHLYSLLKENPEFIYNQLKDFYGFDAEGQGQSQDEEVFDYSSPDADISQHPKFKELMENQQRMEQFLQSEHQTRQMQEAEQQIEKELASIKASNPDVDELRVIQTAMATGQNLTEAAKIVAAQDEAVLLRSRQNPPAVMSSHGGIPAPEPTDPRKLNNTDTRNLVASILKAQHNT